MMCTMGGLLLVIFFFLECDEAMPVVQLDVVVDLGNRVRLLLAQLVQMFQSSLEHLAASLHFFAVRSCGTGKSQSADQRRERQALEYEGHEDDAEGEEDDHIALGKRLAVGEGFRDGNRGSECDDAAHAGPADDKTLPRAGTRYFLAEQMLANVVCDVTAGIHPNEA